MLNRLCLAGVTVLLAVNSMLMNQPCILSKVFLNRNKHKTWVCTDNLMKIL